MDKNTVIGLVLIFALFIGFSIWNAPTAEEQAALKKKQDSIVLAQKEEVRINDSIAKITKTNVQDTINLDSNITLPKQNQYGYFSIAANNEESFTTVENKYAKYTFSNLGGRISSVELKGIKTYDSKPLVLFNSDSNYFGVSFFSNSLLIETQKLYFDVFIDKHNASSSEKTIEVNGNDSMVVHCRLYPNTLDSTQDKSKYFEFAYTIYGENYMTKLSLNIVNMKSIIQDNTTSMELTWKSKLQRLEKSYSNEHANTTIYFKDSEDVDYISETKSEKKNFTTGLKWVSFKQHFFSSTLIASNLFESGEIETKDIPNNDKYLKEMNANLVIPISSLDKSQFDMTWYFGPNKYSVLREFDLDLERQIPLGWSFAPMAWINRFAVIPVFNWLENYGWNYGIIILILTILLKIVLLPIAYKTYLSSAKMRLLKPEIEEIAKRYPKQEDTMKKQQATMALQKKAGVNPMAGCIPMLLQLPILLALFRFFPSSYELRQQSFLWADDLSAFDSIYDLPFDIPFYGDHISLFTILMTAATLLYTKLNNDMMNTGAQNMKAMKIMMYIMPIMFLGIFNNYAAGLSYYYFLVNVITFLQMFIFRYVVNEDKLHKQIEANKLKPVKKSNWAKRLEELQKQQQQNAKRR